MPDLIEQAVSLLAKMYSQDEALFSYSACLSYETVVNDFDSPTCLRYTVNVLAGLQRVPAEAGTFLKLETATAQFIEKHLDAMTSVGDRGLLLFVLANGAGESPTLRRSLLKIASTKETLRRATLQELCWLLLGLSRQAEMRSDDEAAQAARHVFTLVEREYMNHDTLFPYHSSNRLRRRFVSFGSVTYFLMALHEYARVMGDAYADTLFREGVQVIIGFQGTAGEWAWFYDADRARIVDWYEIYTVHQAAMAPLFLLPAVDAGVEGAVEAVERGYRWIFGENELGVSMLQTDPFFTFRSLRRRGPLTRARRYVRGAASRLPAIAGRRAPAWALELNPECRSYELGWLIYAWADRRDFSDFRTLAVTETLSSAHTG